ncbi:MAG: hypothetical protein AMXMBFR64_59510 [Myxococcales bacterium]
MALRPDCVLDARTGIGWRFQEQNRGWGITLSPDFLVLETTRYTSRADFMERLETPAAHTGRGSYS